MIGLTKLCVLLTLAMSAPSYEFAGNVKLTEDIFAGIKGQSLDIPVTWFLKQNLGRYPTLDPTGGPQANIPVFLAHIDVTNRAMQTAMALAANDPKYFRIYPVYMVSVLDAAARIQPDIHAFMGSIPKTDPTYETRIAGFQKMNNGFVTAIISLGLCMGEKQLDDETKIYALASLKQILPKYRGYLNAVLMTTCLEFFKRYDLSDQAKEVQDELKAIRTILSQW